MKPWMTGPKPEVIPSTCASLTLVQPVAVHPHIESVSKLPASILIVISDVSAGRFPFGVSRVLVRRFLG